MTETKLKGEGELEMLFARSQCDLPYLIGRSEDGGEWGNAFISAPQD